MTDSAARQEWWPDAPEMCGQCASGEFSEIWSNEADSPTPCVLVEFRCEGCGYIVSKYGYPEQEAESA